MLLRPEALSVDPDPFSKRREAEYHASQLKKKVAELQFLLEEKLAEDDDESDEEESPKKK